MIEIKTKLGKIFNKSNVLNVVNQELRRAMTESVLLGETVVAELTKVGATANLRQGVTGIVESVTKGKIAVIGPSAKYAPVVEFGRRPGGKFPPPDAIEFWLKRSNKGKVFVQSIRNKYPKSTLKQAVFLKSRGIARRGTKAVKMFSKGEKKIKPRVLKFFNKAVDRIERRLSD